LPTFPTPRQCLMANPHQLPPSNTAFGRLSAASSPLPTRSSTPAVDYPEAFTAEQLASARASLRLNPRDFPDFSLDTLSGLIPSETATLTLLSHLVRGLVTISQELSGVTQKLTSLAEENDSLKEELHDLSSQIANLQLPQTPPPHQDLSFLRSAIRDLLHRVTAPAPPLPQATTPTRQPQPPVHPAPSKKENERARAPPSPPPNANEDPKYLIPFNDTKLGRAFDDLERYAQLFPPDIAARVLRESNCLLPLGFSASVNIRGPISLTVTDKATPAASYAPYVESLTRTLNQSFPVGKNQWAPFILAPTAAQLAIHALPLRFLHKDAEELFPYLRQAILNHKATPILSARYLDPSRDSRGTKQATSVVVTVNPQHVAALIPGVVFLSQKRKVELGFSASRSSQCRNC